MAGSSPFTVMTNIFVTEFAEIRENSNDSPNFRPVSLFIPVAIFLEIKSGDILKQTSCRFIDR